MVAEIVYDYILLKLFDWYCHFEKFVGCGVGNSMLAALLLDKTILYGYQNCLGYNGFTKIISVYS